MICAEENSNGNVKHALDDLPWWSAAGKQESSVVSILRGGAVAVRVHDKRRVRVVRKMKKKAQIPVFVFILLFLLSSFCKSDDHLTHAKPLFPGNTLVSKGGDFAIGFFSPASSNESLYLCIWYHNIPERTVVWTANRDNAIAASSSPMLAITNSSDLVLSDSQGRTPWTVKNNISGTLVVAVLLDTGNFVLQSSNGTSIWQSFDHPTDTVLPVVWHGTRPYFRILMLNGVSVSGGIYQGILFTEAVVGTGDGFYYRYTIVSDNSPYVRFTIDYKGVMRTLAWNNSSPWSIINERPASSYDLYASCGPFGYVYYVGTAPTCHCLDGFEPAGLNFSVGCRRTEALSCDKQSHFVPLPAMKIPDKFSHLLNRNFDQCEAECISNCSCKAYAYANLSSNSGMADQSRCLVWTGDLVDAAKYIQFGENLYLRLAGSRASQRQKKIQKMLMLRYLDSSSEFEGKNMEFPFVSFDDIAAATDNFADSKQIGRGGFGKVYMGMLEGVNEVAIKRLSKDSGQGIEEFKNEIVLIAKLQHRNLVRLLGCCIHGDERILIYEYLPNKSLDSFLFDATRQSVLDWPTRFKIIKGVARGLLYLHQDSRLTIIHRDLKASNILLDSEMIPKISDFGMARIFGGNQQQANTTRVVGTYGYMSPEYVMGGAFSVKSDTYSFGVLLLEIVSGLKISSPQLIMNFTSLTTYVSTEKCT
ncbi:unnamed protein product [Alopecurus aequalis]